MSRISCVGGSLLLAGIAVAVVGLSGAFAQTRPAGAGAATFPSRTLEEGWERTDQRLVFLTAQLSSVETSLRAVNKAITVTGYKQQVQADRAGTARLGNELMDRKGGGPVPWDQFYGKTARQFAVTVPPGTIVMTKYKGPATDMAYPTNDPLRRPKQFDYIYRANAENEKRADAEAAALGGKVEALVGRRRELEREQAGLWCKIAFQLIEGRELEARPLYHFALKAAGTDGADAQRAEAVRALVRFVRVAEASAAQAVKWVESDDARAFADLRKNVAAARSDLQATVMAQPTLVGEAYDTSSPLGTCVALARRLADVASNVTDASALAVSRDLAGDESQKQTFRGALQDGVLDYAAAVLKLDETVSRLGEQWRVTPDTGAEAPAVKLVAAADAPAAPVRPVATAQPVVTSVSTATPKADKAAAESGGGKAAESGPKEEGSPAKKDTVAAAAAPPKTPIGKPVYVTVSALNNQFKPAMTGVHVTKGQVFVVTPDPAGRWCGGGTKRGKFCDYRGYFPNTNDDWMKMICRVGSVQSVVVSGAQMTAPMDGEVELFCWDAKVDLNSGEIRAAVEIKR